MTFTFHPMDLPGVLLVEPRVYPDVRGHFLELFKRSAFAEHIPYAFVQDNLSRSVYGVIRGLHFQRAPKAQGKLVTVVKGKIWDVAVNIRPESPTFRKWVAVELSDERPRLLWIPPGFAHGFQVLSEEAWVLYKTTAEYTPDLDRVIRFDDPELGIPWPLSRPILSEKDRNAPLLKEILHELVF